MPPGNLAASIDGLLSKRGSPMAGLGSVFVATGKKYGVDPRLVVSISGIESSFGTRPLGAHNAWGWGPGKPFSSWEEGISAVTKGLRDGYYSRGLYTPQQIVRRYAPASDGNDEQNWANTVSGFIKDLGGTYTVSRVVSPSTVPSASSSTSSSSSVPKSSDPLAFRRQAILGTLSTAMQRHGHIDPFSLLQNFTLGAIQDLAGQQQGQSAEPVDTSGPHKPAKDFAGRMGVVSAVKQELGLPYSWGGGGPAGPSYGFGRGAKTKGFDCSSLLQYGWAKAGVKIPRVTYDQWKAGRPVTNPRPGDAVFFNMGPKGPEHVGIFIGGGKFIEAAHTGTNIRVSNLAGRSDFVGARTFA